MTPPPLSLDFELGHRRRRKRRHDRIRRRRRAAVLFGTVAGGIAVVVLTVGLGTGAALTSGCSLSSLRPVQIGQNTFVYAADGSLLGSIPAERNRQPVALSQMSPWLPQATVAIEDRRFYEHGGVDYEGIARAFWHDLNAGRVVEGGSTITQQLVRNLYIGNQRTIRRKLTEACLAIKLSRHWSKTRILDEYMNQVYYGNHAYGIEAAAQTYFARSAKTLDLSQSALLAGLPQAPSDYDPFHEPGKALARRNEVLRALLTTRRITLPQYELAAADDNLHLHPGRLYTEIKEPYFFSYVREQLQKEYGSNTVRSGGLSVYTTIDPRLQRLAQKAIRDNLYLRTDPASAVVSIDPGTGAIRAMTAVVPGRKGNQFNLAAQAHRQPGSTFKPFVLATAISEGINPDTTYYTSAPFSCSTGPWCFADPWHVQTYDHTYLGSTSITNATLRSDNTVYAQLTLDADPRKVRAMAERLGAHMYQPTVAAMGLGALALSPLDLASAYATFAAGGVHSKPMAITKVVFPNGKADKEAGWGKPQRTRVISDGIAWEVTQVLEKNMSSGTGTTANLWNRPDAGKTGTTENHADAWFCGYTPNLETTVWVGYPQAEVPMESVHGIAVAGANFPSQIWHEYMNAALWKAKAVDFAAPRHYPVWRSSFTRGHYELGYVPTYSSSTTTATTATTSSRPATTGSTPPRPKPTTTTHTVPPPPPPPPTTTPPPTEPPPTTTSPPPAPAP